MTDVPYQQNPLHTAPALNRRIMVRLIIPIVLIGLALLSNLTLIMSLSNLAVDDLVLTDSTLGELLIWMAEQSEEEAPPSLLGQYAKTWAEQTNNDILDETLAFTATRQILVGWATVNALLMIAAILGLVTQARWVRVVQLLALISVLAMIFVVPPIDNHLPLIMLTTGALVVALVTTPGPLTKVISFFAVLSIILLLWQTGKALAQSQAYDITLPAQNWAYQTYETLDMALAGLQAGEVDAVITDRNDVRDLAPPFPLPADEETDTESLTYPDLRYLTDLDTHQATLGFLPVVPEFPGRLAVVVPAAHASALTTLDEVFAVRVGTPAGEFADERYLAENRETMLLDLKILNDINLPHLQHIAEALLQPARRNGPFLLVRILSNAALFTWGEAILGFVSGGLLGFVLGTLFAHFAPLERGLLPYVVASQTVPILAIAPMVVIWLGAGPQAVAVISAYLTFFPVTINTLRGLRSPHPNTLELMRSYAASPWAIMWKVRFPAALPYIFTALKVSATASVVGAIIGELPSSMGDGLGRAILDFSSDYSLISTPKLWATILIAASVGILSFLVVSLIEYLIIGRYSQEK